MNPLWLTQNVLLLLQATLNHKLRHINYLNLLLFKDNSGPANLTNNTGLHLKKRIKYFLQYDEISQTYKAIYFFGHIYFNLKRERSQF